MFGWNVEEEKYFNERSENWNLYAHYTVQIGNKLYAYKNRAPAFKVLTFEEPNNSGKASCDSMKTTVLA